VNRFKQFADLINRDAVRRSALPNDLLPPRPEDRVAGELELRFAEELSAKLNSGNYEPTQCLTINVPKNLRTTRPAALLTLADRVVFESLVNELRPRINNKLLGEGVVFWPRAITIKKRWRDFEIAPLNGSAFVTRADIASFYETVDHGHLKSQLISLTGLREVAETLEAFLGRVMGCCRGLPQGLEPSDALATAILDRVDRAMTMTGISYFRHGDDIRMASQCPHKSRAALYELEQSLRSVGLTMNGTKSFTMRSESYQAKLSETDVLMASTKEKLLHKKISQLAENENELSVLLTETGNEELGWQFLYHGNIGFSEVIESLMGHITPGEVRVAEEVFASTANELDSTESILHAETIYHRLTSSLVKLAAGKSPAAIPYMVPLLSASPELTKYFVHYIGALDVNDCSSAIAGLEKMFTPDRFHTPWEAAWYLRLFVQKAEHLPAWAVEFAEEAVMDEMASPVCRAEAAKLLGKLDKLSRENALRLWNILSPCVHPDLAEAVYFAADKNPWATTFLESVSTDPILAVVIRHLKSAERTPINLSKAIQY